MAGPSEHDDRMLLQEYWWSIKSLERLDPTLPKAMHDIRAKYREETGREGLAGSGESAHCVDRARISPVT